MTTIASLLVMVLTIVAGAVWLSRPLRPDDERPGRIGGLPSDSGACSPVEAGLLASMRRHPSALPAVPLPGFARPAVPHAPLAPTPHLHAQARLVFATLRDGNILLDCVVTESAGGDLHPDVASPNTLHVAAGLPITLSLGEVGTPWLAVHIEAMLERWAEGERIVDLELRDSPLGPRATLVSASSRLVLPLATVSGLS